MPFLPSLVSDGACQTVDPEYTCLARVKDAPHEGAAVFVSARVCVTIIVFSFRAVPIWVWYQFALGDS